MVARDVAIAGAATVAAVAWWLVVQSPRSDALAEPVVLQIEGRTVDGLSLALLDGQAVVAWGARAETGGADVYLAVSHDEGLTFDAPVRVNDVPGTARVGGEMPPRIAFSDRPGETTGVIDVLWTAIDGATTVRLARSEDGGRTFAPSRSVQAPDAPGDRGWATLAADRSGQTHAVWLDHRGMAAGSDQGAHTHSETHDHVASAADEGLHDISGALGSSLYYAASDGERELFPSVCYCCKTAMAAGADGRVFVAWRHVYPQNMRDIAFTVSTDGGRSFAEPVRVSTDDWQINGCPDDGPALAVDGRGAVHLAWPTLVSQPEAHKAIFYAFSEDGRTFAPRRRLSADGISVSHPQIAVSDEGDVVVVWDEVVGGIRRVAASRIDSSGDVSTLSIDASSDGVRASYPVAAFGGDTLLAAWVEASDTASRVIVWRIEIPGAQ